MKTPLILCAMVALSGTMGIVAFPALSAEKMAAEKMAAQKLVVEKNHTYRVALPDQAGSVVVGNPDIADVTVVDSRTLFIVARGVGNSGVTITNRAGRTIYNAEVTVTSANEGAITVYKGLTPSLMVCTNVCVAQEVSSATAAPVPPVVPTP